MPVTCANCGTSNPSGFRFCGACGEELAPGTDARREVRKTVTVLFCDVAGSTSLAEQLDPEALRRVLSGYFEEMRRILERHGGRVEKFIGDAVVGVFGVPAAHEDDALRAVRAAAEMRDAASATAMPAAAAEAAHGSGGLAVRIGVNTGPVLAGGPQAGGSLVTGDAVNVAARLQQAAQPSEILLGPTTLRLVRDAVTVEPAGPLALRGREAVIEAARLLSVDTDAPGHARRLDAPLVARERELQDLRDAFASAAGERACVLFTVLGSAGVGKSRLVHEFLAGIPEQATVVRGRCLPYGEGITWWPAVETVRALAGITDADDSAAARARIATALGESDRADVVTERVAALLGLAEAPGSADETMWALRRLYERSAAKRPLVVVFDDIHWGEATFLDFIEHVADWSRDAPMLLVCIARPELLEERPNWGGGKLRARTILLEPLSGDAVALLVDHLVGGGLGADVVARVGEAAEGNPLFVEEFLEMLVDDGLLRFDDDRWIASGDLTNVAIPPTVAALLASRLDRLRPPERSVVERAAVVGKVFWRGAVAELSPEQVRPEIGRHLLALVRKELVRPDDSSSLGDEAYRFRHLLVRDAAYDALPKDDRSDLHARFADWLARIAADRVAEYEELIGYHLEQSHRYRVEVGGDGEDAARIGWRAAEFLGRAGRRAVILGDVAAASSLLGRAVQLLPSGSRERTALLCDLIDARIEGGRFDDARALSNEVIAAAEGRPELEPYAWRARVYRGLVELLGEGAGRFADVLPLLDEAIAAFTRLDDEDGLAMALLNRGQLLYGMGQLAVTADSHRRAVRHAERAGATALLLEASVAVAAPRFYGMTPVDEAATTVEELIDTSRRAGSRMGEARGFGYLGRLAALDGRFDEARVLTRAGVAAMEELGRALYVGGSRHWTGYVEVVAEEWAAAAREFRTSVELLDTIGERSYLSTSAAELAIALAKLGRLEEALAAADRSDSLAAVDDVASQTVILIARAEVARRTADPDRAVAFALEAVNAADTAEYSAERFRSRLVAAEALAAAGNSSEAASRAQQAVEIGEARRARAWIATATRVRDAVQATAGRRT